MGHILLSRNLFPLSHHISTDQLLVLLSDYIEIFISIYIIILVIMPEQPPSSDDMNVS